MKTEIRRLMTMLAAIFLLVAVSASATVPQLISYQGRLTNSVGAPLDTTVTIDFTIYKDSLGTLDVWSETHPGVVIQDGLFQVLLGSITPLSASVFDGSKRWLGVQLQGGHSSTALIPIVSVAYAYRSVKSDTASYALSSGGASGGGWTDDGTTVSLSTVGDSVGIGTSNPAFRLDVAGGLRATDSLQTNKVALGKSLTTTGALSLYSSLTSQPIVQLSGSSTGGTIQVRDEAGNSSLFLKSSTEPGGLLTIARNAAGSSGFYVDGNTGTEEPMVSVLGSSRSAIFDMSASGDSSVMLPNSSISSFEMSNEAGVASSRRTTVVPLTDTLEAVVSRMVRFPTDGYAFVVASGTINWYHTWEDTVSFGVSNSATSFPVSAHTLHWPDALPNGSYSQPLMTQGYFSVDAGIQTFYLLVKRPLYNQSYTVSNANLAVMFFPTNYLYINVPASASGGGMDAEQLELDQLIEQRIAEREAALRKEFDAKLKTVLDNLKSELKNGGN